MTLDTSIADYVGKRRAEGLQFISSENILKAFSRHCGTIGLPQLAAQHVESFLCKRPSLKSVTNAARFSVVKCFCEHAALNGEIANLQLSPPARPDVCRLPFIFALQDLRSLLRAVDECQNDSTVLDPSSFRLLIPMLYSTGAGLGEALTLTRHQVDLRRSQVELMGGPKRKRRKLPMGRTLRAELSQFLRGSIPRDRSAQLICRSDGKALTQKYLASRFRRLINLAGVSHAPDCVPRLQDLRYTFAVHSLTNWHKAKRDVNTLLPSLSTYMGYSDLGAAERFCALTPERFRSELEKLSPSDIA